MSNYMSDYSSLYSEVGDLVLSFNNNSNSCFMNPTAVRSSSTYQRCSSAPVDCAYDFIGDIQDDPMPIDQIDKSNVTLPKSKTKPKTSRKRSKTMSAVLEDSTSQKDVGSKCVTIDYVGFVCLNQHKILYMFKKK
jgi:hypothetical protein